MSKRQDRKNERAGKKDKNGFPLTLSRANRRAGQRLQRRMNDYEASPKGPESDQQYCKPGKQAHY